MTTDWQRGFQAGLQSAREMVDGAQSALQREREDHRRWQALMTDALAQAEAQTLKDEALLRQALEALELRCGTNADERKALIHALRERLGLKE